MHWAEEAGRRLATAEYDIGCVHNVLHNNGIISISLDASGPCRLKRRHSGSSPSTQAGSPINVSNSQYASMCRFTVLYSLQVH